MGRLRLKPGEDARLCFFCGPSETVQVSKGKWTGAGTVEPDQNEFLDALSIIPGCGKQGGAVAELDSPKLLRVEGKSQGAGRIGKTAHLYSCGRQNCQPLWQLLVVSCPSLLTTHHSSLTTSP